MQWQRSGLALQPRMFTGLFGIMSDWQQCGGSFFFLAQLHHIGANISNKNTPTIFSIWSQSSVNHLFFTLYSDGMTPHMHDWFLTKKSWLKRKTGKTSESRVLQVFWLMIDSCWLYSICWHNNLCYLTSAVPLKCENQWSPDTGMKTLPGRKFISLTKLNQAPSPASAITVWWNTVI